MTKLLVKLINAENVTVGTVEMDDLKRKSTDLYARRSVIRMGVKYMEPEPAALEFIAADEWHEVIP